MRILLLVSTLDDIDISHALYANSLRGSGHEVLLASVNELMLVGSTISCPMIPVREQLTPFAPVPGKARTAQTEQCDLIWVLNQPHDRIAADVWQLLWRLNLKVPFVNDTVGLLMLNNKNNLSLVVPELNCPWYASLNFADEAFCIMASRPDCSWVAKPTNGGCGANVFVLVPGNTNNRAIIQSLTGNMTAASQVTRGGLVGLHSDYCVLQEFVEHETEKRIIIAGGVPIAAQAKFLPNDDHRGNVTQNATRVWAELSSDEDSLARTVGAALLRYGIRFAGIDVAYPAVFEINLVNPGGIDPIKSGEPPVNVDAAIQSIINALA